MIARRRSGKVPSAGSFKAAISSGNCAFSFACLAAMDGELSIMKTRSSIRFGATASWNGLGSEPSAGPSIVVASAAASTITGAVSFLLVSALFGLTSAASAGGGTIGMSGEASGSWSTSTALSGWLGFSSTFVLSRAGPARSADAVAVSAMLVAASGWLGTTSDVSAAETTSGFATVVTSATVALSALSLTLPSLLPRPTSDASLLVFFALEL